MSLVMRLVSLDDLQAARELVHFWVRCSKSDLKRRKGGLYLAGYYHPSLTYNQALLVSYKALGPAAAMVSKAMLKQDWADPDDILAIEIWWPDGYIAGKLGLCYYSVTAAYEPPFLSVNYEPSPLSLHTFRQIVQYNEKVQLGPIARDICELLKDCQILRVDQIAELFGGIDRARRALWQLLSRWVVFSSRIDSRWHICYWKIFKEGNQIPRDYAAILYVLEHGPTPIARLKELGLYPRYPMESWTPYRYSPLRASLRMGTLSLIGDPPYLALGGNMQEKHFLSQVKQLAKCMGWMTFHHPYSLGADPGFPDLFLYHPLKDRIILAELKGPRGKLSDRQKEWLRELATSQKLEAYVWFPQDLDEIVRILKDEKAGQRSTTRAKEVL